MLERTVCCRPILALSLVAVLFSALAGCDGHDETAATSSAPTPSEALTPTSYTSARVPEYEPTSLPEVDVNPDTLVEQRRAMLRRMQALHMIDGATAKAIEDFLADSKMAGQGNPAIVEHPLTRRQCLERRKAAGVEEEQKPACGAPFMAPIWDPATETEADAPVCVDRYEFPGIPCEYPMTWVTAAQAAKLCELVGKRLCDAHEWEGACAGALHPPEQEYAFGHPRMGMEGLHNIQREIRWAYGPKKDHLKCATQSHKSKGCTSSGWKKCGSNTYPAGSFPECRSPFGIYDQHGNVAEHMALPMKPEDLGAKNGWVPEMKGSWFIFASHEAHQDDCRWRCPAWHDNEGRGHANYHLGFRCCKDIHAP